MTDAAPTLDAAVLVGHATRLPGKFDLVMEGATVLDRVLAAVRDAGFRPTIVAVPGAGRTDPSVVLDPYDRGPLGGVRAFLERRAAPFLLVGGDMPFLRAEDLRTLRARFRPGICVVPRRPDGTFEVLFGLYDLPLERVTRYWTAGRSLRDLVRDGVGNGTVDAVPVGVFDPRSFVDLDTAEDLARWRADPATRAGSGSRSG